MNQEQIIEKLKQIFSPYGTFVELQKELNIPDVIFYPTSGKIPISLIVKATYEELTEKEIAFLYTQFANGHACYYCRYISKEFVFNYIDTLGVRKEFFYFCERELTKEIILEGIEILQRHQYLR